MNHRGSCGSIIETSSRFCGICGSPLILPAPPAATPDLPASPARNLAIPIYLRWYSILLSFIFWPACVSSETAGRCSPCFSGDSCFAHGLFRLWLNPRILERRRVR
jgi:hypothetical protein